MNKGGRPPYQPTAKDRIYVEALSSYGVPDGDIARVVGVSITTLHKHYRDQVETGHIIANAKVAGFLFKAAEKGSVPAMMFWLRCRAGWSEPRVLADELGKKGAAVIEAQRPDVSTNFGRVIAERARRKPDEQSVPFTPNYHRPRAPTLPPLPGGSPVGAKHQDYVGFEPTGLGTAAAERPIADTRSAA